MGRTEANEKHRPTALKRGAGGGTRLAQLFQLQMNGRRSVSPIARRIKPKRNDVLNVAPRVPRYNQQLRPPACIAITRSRFAANTTLRPQTFVIGHKPRLFAASSSATIARSRRRASVGRAPPASPLRISPGNVTIPVPITIGRAQTPEYSSRFSADGLTSSASDLKTIYYRMKGCSISSTRGCNPMTIRR